MKLTFAFLTPVSGWIHTQHTNDRPALLHIDSCGSGNWALCFPQICVQDSGEYICVCVCVRECFMLVSLLSVPFFSITNDLLLRPSTSGSRAPETCRLSGGEKPLHRLVLTVIKERAEINWSTRADGLKAWRECVCPKISNRFRESFYLQLTWETAQRYVWNIIQVNKYILLYILSCSYERVNNIYPF